MDRNSPDGDLWMGSSPVTAGKSMVPYCSRESDTEGAGRAFIRMAPVGIKQPLRDRGSGAQVVLRAQNSICLQHAVSARHMERYSSAYPSSIISTYNVS